MVLGCLFVLFGAVYTFALINRPLAGDLSVQRQRYHAHLKCAKV